MLMRLCVSILALAVTACGLPISEEKNVADSKQEQEVLIPDQNAFDIPTSEIGPVADGPCADGACVAPMLILRGSLAVHPASVGINTNRDELILSWGQSGDVQLSFADTISDLASSDPFVFPISECTEVEGAQSTCVWEVEVPAAAFAQEISVTLEDMREVPLFESTRALLLTQSGLQALKESGGVMDDAALYAVSRESVEHLAGLPGNAYDAQAMRENGFIFGNAHNPENQPQPSVSVSTSSENLDVYYTNQNYSTLISRTCMPGFFFIVSHEANTVTSNLSFSGAGYVWTELSAELKPGLATVLELWAGLED